MRQSRGWRASDETPVHAHAILSTTTKAGGLVLLGIAVLMVSINMRPAIVATSPLLATITESTGLSDAAGGVLSTLPLICFALFAPLAPRMARRFGMDNTLFGVLAVLLIGILLRLIPALPGLFIGSAIIGAAVAVANVVVTAIIKRNFGHKVGLMSGLHTTMLVGGAALAAGLTVPARTFFGLNWITGLAIWGIPVVIALVLWIPGLIKGHAEPRNQPPPEGRSIWSDKLAWAVTLFYAFQSLIYYTSTTWLPSIFVSHGYSEAGAGWLLSLTFGCAVLTSVSVPMVAERSAHQGYLAVIGGALCTLAVLGLLIAPEAAAVAWSASLGLGLGTVLSLGITYMSMRAGTIHEAGQLSAMSQAVGYGVAAVGPFLFGLAHDITNNWTLGLIALGLFIIPMTMTGISAGRNAEISLATWQGQGQVKAEPVPAVTAD